jgi:hypothetical protein
MYNLRLPKNRLGRINLTGMKVGPSTLRFVGRGIAKYATETAQARLTSETPMGRSVHSVLRPHL